MPRQTRNERRLGSILDDSLTSESEGEGNGDGKEESSSSFFPLPTIEEKRAQAEGAPRIYFIYSCCVFFLWGFVSALNHFQSKNSTNHLEHIIPPRHASDVKPTVWTNLTRKESFSPNSKDCTRNLRKFVLEQFHPQKHPGFHHQM
jgi:hypothetical protein